MNDYERPAAPERHGPRPGHVNVRQMSLRDIAFLLTQIARELQNRERGGGGGFRPRQGGRPQGAGGGWGGHGGGGQGGGQGGGHWKQRGGPRRGRPDRFPHGDAPSAPQGGFDAGPDDGPGDNIGNREGANIGRFGTGAR